MKYFVYTLGCKFNQYESAKIAAEFQKMGYSDGSANEADIVVINSCAVTKEAARKSLQMARHFKRINEKAKIIFTGCAVYDKRDIKDFDLVIGNGEKIKINDFVDKKGTFVDFSYHLKDDLNYTIEKIPNHTRAFLSVENGCNWSCAYCAIPHFRGTRVRSKPLDVVVKEAAKMVENGVKEIVVTGINIALYDDGENDLYALLNALTGIDGNFRIRIGSIDPVSLLKLAKIFENPKLCPHAHLSVQSGSDEVLRRMKRRYTSRDVIECVNTFRKMDPFFAFSVDVIAGFPQESEKEFDETYKLLKELEVSRIHAFPFSRRSHTLADSMKGQISALVKKERTNKLRELGRVLEKRFAEKTKAIEKTVLIEKVKDGVAEGLDEYYVRRFFKYEGKEGVFVKMGGKVISDEGLQ
ncbi:tRNA (N(6)-L-threonylcarbamoyladenosine(37)-C(2))-methylthiotransferase MtaB [Mesoaciditoga sp.]